MDRDKILEAARRDKYRGREYENEEGMRGSLLSVAVSLIVGVGLFVLEYYTKGTVNIGLIAVGCTVAGVDSLYEGIKLKRTGLKIVGIVMSLTAIAAIALFVGQAVMA